MLTADMAVASPPLDNLTSPRPLLARQTPTRHSLDSSIDTSIDLPRVLAYPHNTPEAFDAVILSDIHLGSDNCQAKLVVELLESILDGQLPTRRVIINGDVFDSIDFRRLKKTHWKVLSLIRHLSDKTEMIWIAGNHDGSAEIVSQLLGVEVKDDYVLPTGGKQMFLTHGHFYDAFIDNHPLLTWCGDLIYYCLQKMDKSHRIARLAKRKTKIFLRSSEKIERDAIAAARRKNCTLASCGHTHHAKVSETGDVWYYNSGCWTELPCSYLRVKDGAVTLEWKRTPAEEDAAKAAEGQPQALTV